MPTNNDKYVGTIVGQYEVLELMPYRDSNNAKLYRARCLKCGKERISRIGSIKDTTTCQYGHTFTQREWTCPRLRNIYSKMKDRCTNSNRKDSRWYHDKGIKICQEWLENPLLFEKWALENGYEDGLTIDRLDETKDYCPENCHWIPQIDNSKYKSTTHLYTAHNEIHTGREWAKICNLGTNTINTIARNYNVEIAEKFIEARLDSPNEERIGTESWLEHYGII